MAKTLPFSMRMLAPLKANLQKLADADNRSLTNYIETVLTDHVNSITGRATTRLEVSARVRRK